MNSLLVITGGMGAGKSTVLGEASDILAARGITHAAIDLDALGLAFLPHAATTDDAMYGNLRSVCENYAALGVRRFLVARAVETHAQLATCRDAVSATDIAVCRLLVSLETMQQRVRMRETGLSHREFVARVAELNVILDHTPMENFSVINEDRLISDVALEVLVRAKWIPN